jgi:hypothetical protein
LGLTWTIPVWKPAEGAGTETRAMLHSRWE